MDFSKKFTEIREQLDDETVAKVGTHLKDLERGIGDLLDDAKSSSGESKGRKLKIREMEAEKEKLQDEVDKLKLDNSSEKIQKEYDDMKKENESLREYKTSVLKSRRESFVTKFDNIKDHVNFEKVSNSLKVAEEKDGKRDWSKVTDEEIETNLSEIQKAEDWGIFEKGRLNEPPNPNSLGKTSSKEMFKGKFSE